MNSKWKCLVCDNGGHVIMDAQNGWYRCEDCGIEYSEVAMQPQEEVNELVVEFLKDSTFLCSSAFLYYKMRT